jgi:hypothetical protein
MRLACPLPKAAGRALTERGRAQSSPACPAQAGRNRAQKGARFLPVYCHFLPLNLANGRKSPPIVAKLSLDRRLSQIPDYKGF